MNQKRVTLALVAIGLISGGYYWWRNSSPYDRVPRQDVAVEVFGGQQNLDVFLSATNVTVQRVHYRGRSQGDPGFLSDFGETNSYTYEGPLQVTAPHCEEIRRLLNDPASYVWNSSKGCMPEFGMVFHFHSGNQIVSAAFCFHCKQLVIFDGATNPPKPLNMEEDFDPIKDKLIAIARAIFPNDAEVRELK